MDTKTFAVWEPAIESAEKASRVEASTPGQAAFFVANERKIGYRSATYTVHDGAQCFSVDIEPHTHYQVGVPKQITEAA